MMKNKKGFTLAEVLITLGIIGVVAALTIPTLISNYQKKEYVVALQKTYATITQGFKLMLATEGVDYLANTKFYRQIEKDESGTPTNFQSVVDSMNENLKKYFKVSEVCIGANCSAASIEYSYLNGEPAGDMDLTTVPYMQLADGSYVYFTVLNSTYTSKLGSIIFMIDVNGPKGPNVMGRDTFYYLMAFDTKKGFKVGAYLDYYEEFKDPDQPSVTYAEMNEGSPDEACGAIGSEDTGNAIGLFCLDRIKAENWQMNY